MSGDIVDAVGGSGAEADDGDGLGATAGTEGAVAPTDERAEPSAPDTGPLTPSDTEALAAALAATGTGVDATSTRAGASSEVGAADLPTPGPDIRGVAPPLGDDIELVGADPAARPASRERHVPALSIEGLLGRWSITDLVSLTVAVACSLFVLAQMRPDLLLSDTTPSGGDMGAHVWGPAFLRDSLLSEGRLAGWTPDWYAGFPAYRFYMVVPSLAIVAINAGFRPLLGIPVVLIVIGLTFFLTRESDNRAKIRLVVAIASLLLLSVPYGISFKLVSVAGLVTFPLSAWAMGRLARAPDPIPPMLSVGALFFLFDTNFTIYGGNIASTLAGEFAFSISLSLCLLAFGLAARGMENGRWRVAAAIVISLIALTHIIPVFFAIVALVALVVLGPSVPRLWPVATAIALALVPVALADGTSLTVTLLAVGAAVVVLAAVLAAESEVWARAKWLLATGPTAALLTGFWLVPFYLREPFFNDMGWERLNEVSPAMLTVPMKIALPVAAIGAIGALASRERIGIMFATTGIVFAAAVANLGEGPLWNARLLPFYYLSMYMLAAVGVALAVRFAGVAVSEDFKRPSKGVTVAASVLVLVVGLIAVAMPLRILPGGVQQADGTYTWLKLTSHAKSFVPSWTAWNYSGYEAKPSYREYRDVVLAMDRVGEVNGCGRAMWEYDKELDRYGTPMALMLLPHWTDGCIGSMEGLYFESSATTPFHFLNQSMLSQNPSRAQRDLPYQNFDINRGVAQLQVMGVRYYMAQEDASIAAARAHPELTEMGEAQPFVIFEVADSDLVEGLTAEPVVVAGRSEEDAGEVATRFDVGWLGEAVTFYNDPGAYNALPAEEGPGDWQRVTALLPTDGAQLDPAVVSDVDVGTSSISFSVDEVGKPVLVKVSYFPNWDVDGADGPWRLGPNLMAVVPTSNRVELSYGRTAVDWFGILVTLIGIGLLALLYLGDRRRWSDGQHGEVWGGEDVGWDDDLAELAASRPPFVFDPASSTTPQVAPSEHADGRPPETTGGADRPALEGSAHPGVQATPTADNGRGSASEDDAEARPADEGEDAAERPAAFTIETSLSKEWGRDTPDSS